MNYVKTISTTLAVCMMAALVACSSGSSSSTGGGGGGTTPISVALTGAQSSLSGRTRRINPADLSGITLEIIWLPNAPDHYRKKYREAETEQWPRKCHDDLIQRRNIGQLFRSLFHLALDGLHGRHLRERDVPAKRNRAEDIFDTPNLLFPQGLAEPDRKALYFQPAPAGGQKMAQLMDADDQVENQDHFQGNEDVV